MLIGPNGNGYMHIDPERVSKSAELKMNLVKECIFANPSEPSKKITLDASEKKATMNHLALEKQTKQKKIQGSDKYILHYSYATELGPYYRVLNAAEEEFDGKEKALTRIRGRMAFLMDLYGNTDTEPEQAMILQMLRDIWLEHKIMRNESVPVFDEDAGEGQKQSLTDLFREHEPLLHGRPYHRGDLGQEDGSNE